VPIDVYQALSKFWTEECPPQYVLVSAIARSLGCKFGKEDMHRKVIDAESLMHHMHVNPAAMPKWEPKPNVFKN
jgi:hypothetical protein